MSWIGKKAADVVTSGQQLANGTITAIKLAAGAVVAHLGYTPVNKAGDTMTGGLALTSLAASSSVRAGNSTRGALYIGGNANSSNDFHVITSPTEGLTIYQGVDGAGVSAMSIDLGRRLRIPDQPCFNGFAIYGTAYSGNIDAINFSNNISINNGNCYNTSGGNAGKFICPVAGRYLVMSHAHIQANGGYGTIQIKQNGVVKSNGWHTGSSGMLHISAIINASAGDAITVGFGTTQLNYIAETYWGLTVALIN